MPVSTFMLKDTNVYLAGIRNYHQSEALPNTIPKGQNIEQRPAHGLYIERISGTSFTTRRAENKQTWLYRIMPSNQQEDFVEDAAHSLNFTYGSSLKHSPNHSSWVPVKAARVDDFVGGIRMIAGAGEPTLKTGVAYYSYDAELDMPLNHSFYNADGDFLIVAQSGTLDIKTELGSLRVRPLEICVVPRGIRFHVSLPDGPVRGFILEAFSGHFELPELGPIGSCGLANEQDFEVPSAAYEDQEGAYEVLAKYNGKLHRAKTDRSTFSVVAWAGTYYPMKYDLGKFNAMGSISFDHPDPSIFTVLTCPSERPGSAAADFVLFGPRWLVMEDSSRPPYYHRNTMSEFAGLLRGGFGLGKKMPEELHGLSFLSNTLTCHGPDRETYDHALNENLSPRKVDADNVGFMFESCYMIGLSDWAVKASAPIPKSELNRNFAPRINMA